MAKECSKYSRETCRLDSDTWDGILDDLFKELKARKPSPDTTASLHVNFWPMEEGCYGAVIDQHFHPQTL